jgi:dienelactone hydrolase
LHSPKGDLMNLSWIPALAMVLLLCACSTPVQRADSLATHAGFSRAVLPGAGFHHVVYERLRAGGPLLIYIDGDGAPWIRDGREVAADPTPRDALALELAVRTNAGSVLYLGRPCYFGLAATPECHPADWTFDRYSAAVVASLVAAANQFVRAHDIRDVVLIGHSGGGTLAVLMAPQMLHLRAIVTIAANLDVKAWTSRHGYLPLSGSLDPSDQPPVAGNISEIDLAGALDRNVPPALLGRYLTAHPAARLWTFPRFDHRCCWAQAWPTLLPQLLTDSASPAAQRSMRR